MNPGPDGGLAAEVQAWVDANWDTAITVREWWRRLADAGYAYPSWPRDWVARGRRDAMPRPSPACWRRIG